MRIIATVTRTVVAVGITAALIAQIIASVEFANRSGGQYTGNVVVNFFSYFTVDSNALAVVTLFVGAGLLLRGPGPDPTWFATMRLSVVTYMVVTGIVYNLLLRDNLPQGATVPWSNEILHLVAPAYLLLDWIFAPGRRPLPVRALWWAVVFPIVWLAYTLIRGPFAGDPYFHTTHWYPYPFLNPVTAQNGYGTVAFYVVLIAAVVCGIAAGLTWISRLTSRVPVPQLRQGGSGRPHE